MKIAPTFSQATSLVWTFFIYTKFKQGLVIHIQILILIYSIKYPDFSIPHLPQWIAHKLHFVEMAQIYRLLQIRRKLVIIQTLKGFLIARFFPCLILEHMLSFVGMCWMIVQPWFDLAQLIKAHDWVHNCFCNVWVNINKLKFRFSKKATKFETISHMIWIYLVNVKSSGRLFQIFVAFSECPNFKEWKQILIE